MRSDIYSLAATMYHLLTGIRPPQRASEVKPISEYGHFSEGMVYIIEKSMQVQPSERFSSVLQLQNAIINIHKYDMRWKASQAKKVAAAIILPLSFIAFAAAAIFGSRIMAQEKEERYYSAIYNIENAANAEAAYNDALSIHWDRIDPYRAMAERLWNDGDLDACRKYIEENLGNIAEFQVVSDAQRSFGDIYYILGNCYYYQAGEPDYNTAKGNFEIAVRFVKDNPVYYRDYAICLARTGFIEDAERVIKQAQELDLDADSLNLLNGEIDFVKQNYDSAVVNFGKVISLSNDDYLRYRAYHASDEIYRLMGQPDLSAELLSGAMERIPLNRVPEMQERLADAYVKNGDITHAIEIFEQLNENGVPKFHIMQNLVVLYQNINDFDGASDILLKMTDLFPDDYRVPMRQAFLEADIQSNIENENRDYSMTKQYYERAVELYNKNVRPGESDPEMQQLDLLIEQLRANKWID